MNSIELITESIRAATAEEAINLLRTGQDIGVKVEPNIKLGFKTKHPKIEIVERVIRKIYDSSVKNNAKPVYAFQVAMLHPIRFFEALDQNEEKINKFVFITKYINNDWVHELEGYEKFNSDGLNVSEFADDIEERLINHVGDAKKRVIAKNVPLENKIKMLYPEDENGWEMYRPMSYIGAVEYSNYCVKGKYDSEAEAPKKCGWCTAASSDEGVEHWRDYTIGGTPLYIIRNYKTGKSYQVGFALKKYADKYHFNYMSSVVIYDKVYVWFLDQDDKEGDEVSRGHLSEVPRQLLSKIVIPETNGKTLADYAEEKEKASKNYKLKNGERRDKSTEKVMDFMDYANKKRLRKAFSVFNKNVREHGKNITADEVLKNIEKECGKIKISESFRAGEKTNDLEGFFSRKLTNYSNTGKVEVEAPDNIITGKIKKFKIWLEKKPRIYIEYTLKEGDEFSRRSKNLKDLINKEAINDNGNYRFFRDFMDDYFFSYDMYNDDKEYKDIEKERKFRKTTEKVKKIIAKINKDSPVPGVKIDKLEGYDFKTYWYPGHEPGSSGDDWLPRLPILWRGNKFVFYFNSVVGHKEYDIYSVDENYRFTHSEYNELNAKAKKLFNIYRKELVKNGVVEYKNGKKYKKLPGFDDDRSVAKVNNDYFDDYDNHGIYEEINYFNY